MLQELHRLLLFETNLCFFEVEQCSQLVLKFQAIKKDDSTLLFKGKLIMQSNKGKKTISSIYNSLYKLQQSPEQYHLLSSAITVIDLSQKDQQTGNITEDFRLRIFIDKQIQEISLNTQRVDYNYFPNKKIKQTEQKLMKAERQRHENKQVLEEVKTKIDEQKREFEQQKMEVYHQKQQMQKAFSENISGLVDAITNKINREFLKNSKKYHMDKQEQELNTLKMMKKLRRQIKKQKRHKRKSRKDRSRQKRKKKRQLKELNRMIEMQKNGIELQSSQMQMIEDKLYSLKHRERSNNKYKNHRNSSSDSAKDSQRESKKKQNKSSESRKKHKRERKQRHKHRHRHDQVEPNREPSPPITSVNGMSKLRNRFLPIREDNYAIDLDQQAREYIEPSGKKVIKTMRQTLFQGETDKKAKRSRKKAVKQVIEQDQTEYYRRIEDLRKTGIQSVRLDRINRLRQVMKPPPVIEIDEFNPDYNGEPRYKPFINLGGNHSARPAQLFGGMQQAPVETKHIPITFRSDTPAHKNFEIDGNIIRKVSGTEYQQLVFDYPLPTSGIHTITLRILRTQYSYFWLGVIDMREKDRETSYNKKNTITFSCHTGQYVISSKWSKGANRKMKMGNTVRMEIDMNKNAISWYTDDGRVNSAPISKTMQKLTLTPYFEMMIDQDEVAFEH